MKVGDLVYDHDYGMNGMIVDGSWFFTDTSGQQHTWEFLVLLEDGDLVGSDTFSLEARS